MDRIPTCRCSKRTTANSVEFVLGRSQFSNGKEIKEFIRGHAYVNLAQKIRTFVKSVHQIWNLGCLCKLEIGVAVQMGNTSQMTTLHLKRQPLSLPRLQVHLRLSSQNSSRKFLFLCQTNNNQNKKKMKKKCNKGNKLQIRNPLNKLHPKKNSMKSNKSMQIIANKRARQLFDEFKLYVIGIQQYIQQQYQLQMLKCAHKGSHRHTKKKDSDDQYMLKARRSNDRQDEFQIQQCGRASQHRKGSYSREHKKDKHKTDKSDKNSKYIPKVKPYQQYNQVGYEEKVYRIHSPQHQYTHRRQHSKSKDHQQLILSKDQYVLGRDLKSSNTYTYAPSQQSSKLSNQYLLRAHVRSKEKMHSLKKQVKQLKHRLSVCEEMVLQTCVQNKIMKEVLLGNISVGVATAGLQNLSKRTQSPSAKHIQSLQKQQESIGSQVSLSRVTQPKGSIRQLKQTAKFIDAYQNEYRTHSKAQIEYINLKYAKQMQKQKQTPRDRLDQGNSNQIKNKQNNSQDSYRNTIPYTDRSNQSRKIQKSNKQPQSQQAKSEYIYADSYLYSSREKEASRYHNPSNRDQNAGQDEQQPQLDYTQNLLDNLSENVDQSADRDVEHKLLTLTKELDRLVSKQLNCSLDDDKKRIKCRIVQIAGKISRIKAAIKDSEEK